MTREERLKRIICFRVVNHWSILKISVELDMSTYSVQRYLRRAQEQHPELDWPDVEGDQDHFVSQYQDLKDGVRGFSRHGSVILGRGQRAS